MNDDFTKYEAMRDAGASPERVFLQSVSDGVDPITRIRLIRSVFSLTPGEAKQAIQRANEQLKSSD